MLVLRLTSRKAGVALMYHSVDRRAGDLRASSSRRTMRALRAAGATPRPVLPRRPSATRLLDAARSRGAGSGSRWRSLSTTTSRATRRSRSRSCASSGVQRDVLPLGCLARSVRSRSTTSGSSARTTRVRRDLAAVVTARRCRAPPASLHALGVAMVEMTAGGAGSSACGAAPRARRARPGEAGIRRARVRAARRRRNDGRASTRVDTIRSRGLTDAELADAMESGRSELAEAAGAPRRRRSATRTVAPTSGSRTPHVRRASGSATRPAACRSHRASNPLLLGRIGPSLRSVGALALELAFTLVKPESERSSPAPERAAS